MGITATVPEPRRLPTFGASSNRYADECPLLGVKRTLMWTSVQCPLLTQSGHERLKIAASQNERLLLAAGSLGFFSQFMPPFVASRMTAQRPPRRRSQRDGDKPCSSPSSRRTTGCKQPPAKG